MKKYILIASATLLALAACSKVQEAASQKEINFQVANYVQTKADASPVKFTNTDFAAYAWHHAEDGTVTPFIVNEKVGQKGSEWKTLNNTYYWPKSGSLNFVSYSPYMAQGTPTVSEKSIAFKAYTVSDQDLMYADKANGQTENKTPGTYNAVSGANGVPTLFHHALAKLSFKVMANFLEYTNPDNPKDKTTWAVTLQKVTLKGVYNTGDLTLDINADDATWKTDGWKPDTQKTAKDVELVTAANGLKLTTTAQDLYDGKSFFVLPQTLAGKAQQITFKFHIETTLSNGNTLPEDYEKTLDLKDISKLTAWGMNQNIIYTIKIKPTATANEKDPYTDDPTDVLITFDPAEMDWVKIDTDATIEL